MSKINIRWGWFIGIVICGSSIWSTNSAFAEIIPDGTLPNNSSVKLEGNNSIIEGGTQAGGNLFHSFREFSVPFNGAALFNNGVDIQNIISRVTGGSVSNIDGLIYANGTANLFLINPNGIVFGQNAQLNVGGSFVATSANALQFGNVGFFSASEQNIPSPLLTINPSALLFNQINQNAVIQNNSIAFAGNHPAGFNVYGLRVPDGKSLLLVGGNVSMDGGQLNAFGGRVELGGLGEPGTIALGVDGDNLSLIFPENVARTDISLTNSSGVFVTGAGGGNIAVNARNLDILGGSVLAGISQGLGSVGTIAGDVALNATGEIKVVDSNIFNAVGAYAVGNAGNINITAATLSLSDGTQLDTSTFGQGNAGSVSLYADDSISITGKNARITSGVEASGVGKGGNINIRAAALSVADGAQLQSAIVLDTNGLAGQGDAGNVNIDVTGAVTIAGVKDENASGIYSLVSPGGVGKGGDINVTAGFFSLTDGAQVISGNSGKGDAGNVIIDVGGSVSFDNGYILSSTEVGEGGDIRISADSLSVTNGSLLTASTSGKGDAGNVIIDVGGSVSFDNSQAFSTVQQTGIGEGGDIRISADSLSVTNGSLLTASTRGQGDAGNLIIEASDSVSFDNSKAFSIVQPTGVGKGGDIRISADSLFVTNGAQLPASTFGQGDAGNVIIEASDKISFDNSQAFSSVERTGVGKGGDIRIRANFLFVTNGAQLQANTSGQGDAGNVIIEASDSVSFDNSNAFSTVEQTGVGKGGDIRISADSLSVTNGSLLTASSNGQGDAGNVIIEASDKVSFDNSQAFSTVQPTGVGKGGDIRISADSLFVTNDAQLQANASGQGNAGNVIIEASDKVSFDNSQAFSTVERTGVGKGGDIRISADSLSVTNGSLLTASTRGQGDAGNLIIEASDSVSFDNGYAFNIVYSTGVGKGGDIRISADSLSVTNAQLAASTLGQGDAGNVIIKDSNSVSFDNSQAFTTVERTGVGKGGDIRISADSLFVTNDAQLAASTRGQGDAGNIQINAKNSVSVSGTSSISGHSSALFTSTFSNSTGKGGDIIVNTSALRVSNGAVLDARTNNNGLGGNIILNVKQAEILDGGQLLSISSSAGNAGKITLNATDFLRVNGSDSTFNERVEKFPTNVASINASSGFFVRSQSTGSAGDIQVTSPQILLDNSAWFSADTRGGGGNIQLGTPLLILRRGSSITTNASGSQIRGGNINIDTNFLIAFENSDISANSANFRGGNVQINAQGIFGIQFRDVASDKTSDITATGASSELSGNVELNTPDIDPNSGLVNLPTIAADTEVAQTCQAGGNLAKSSFTIIGRGGLPPLPGEALNTDAVQVDLVTLNPSNDRLDRSFVPSKITTPVPEPIIEATGLVLNEKGEIVLTANLPTTTPHSPWLKPASCRAVRNS